MAQWVRMFAVQAWRPEFKSLAHKSWAWSDVITALVRQSIVGSRSLGAFASARTSGTDRERGGGEAGYGWQRKSHNVIWWLLHACTLEHVHLPKPRYIINAKNCLKFHFLRTSSNDILPKFTTYGLSLYLLKWKRFLSSSAYNQNCWWSDLIKCAYYTKVMKIIIKWTSRFTK